jgi:hypothetical protein
MEPSGSVPILSFAPENHEKASFFTKEFTEDGPCSGTFLTPAQNQGRSDLQTALLDSNRIVCQSFDVWATSPSTINGFSRYMGGLWKKLVTASAK